MKTIRLGDLAAIDISNVDKKAKAEEISVTLCNFVDVYHNWIIDGSNARSLMQATARQTQIERFSLRHGQVAITKDSETRDDIGIPTFIDKVPDKTILGYHCALITPIDNMLDGAYLNCVLQTDYAKKYFECNASGSGQRYTLTVEVIADFPVPLPPLDEQIKRAEIFTVIHRALSNSQSICSDLEATAKLLYDYWFVQFDFPDENGKPYKSSGGKMVWNDELKREIPAGWTCVQLNEIASLVNNTVNPSSGTDYLHFSIPAFDEDRTPSLENGGGIESSKFSLPDKCILVSKLNPQFQRVWLVFDERVNKISSTEFLPFVPKKTCSYELLYEILRSDAFYAYMCNCSSSSTGSRKRMPPELCLEYKTAFPKEDTGLLERFRTAAASALSYLADIPGESKQLTGLRDFLLPLLMNGQVTIGDDGK